MFKITEPIIFEMQGSADIYLTEKLIYINSFNKQNKEFETILDVKTIDGITTKTYYPHGLGMYAFILLLLGIGAIITGIILSEIIIIIGAVFCVVSIIIFIVNGTTKYFTLTFIVSGTAIDCITSKNHKTEIEKLIQQIFILKK